MEKEKPTMDIQDTIFINMFVLVQFINQLKSETPSDLRQNTYS